jgi:hypothetical protein
LAAEGSEDEAAVVVDAEAVVEGAAARGVAQAIRVRTGLRVEGRWMIPIFRKAVHCSCLRRVRRWRAAVRMTMPTLEAVVGDAEARQDLSRE